MNSKKHHHEQGEICCDCGYGMAVQCPHKYGKAIARSFDEDIQVFYPIRLEE